MFRKLVLLAPEIALLAMTTAVVLLLCAQVMFRYFVGTSLDWSEEVSRILLIWLTYVGAAVALKRVGHITVDYFVALLPEAMRRYVELFTYALIVAFSAFLCFQGITFALLSETTTFPALQVPVSVQYFGLPVGCLLMVMYGIEHFIGVFRRRGARS